MNTFGWRLENSEEFGLRGEVGSGLGELRNEKSTKASASSVIQSGEVRTAVLKERESSFRSTLDGTGLRSFSQVFYDVLHKSMMK